VNETEESRNNSVADGAQRCPHQLAVWPSGILTGLPFGGSTIHAVLTRFPAAEGILESVKRKQKAGFTAQEARPAG